MLYLILIIRVNNFIFLFSLCVHCGNTIRLLKKTIVKISPFILYLLNFNEKPRMKCTFRLKYYILNKA